MKTFIWHDEYSYYACMANDVDDAREKVKKIFKGEGGWGEMNFMPDVIIEPGECIKVNHANE